MLTKEELSSAGTRLLLFLCCFDGELTRKEGNTYGLYSESYVKAFQYLMGHSDAGVTLNVYTHTSYDYAVDQISKIKKQAE